MRMHVVSDIHNDYDKFTLPTGVEADVTIVAGDMGGRLSGEGRLWLEANIPTNRPTIAVAGNHCFYGGSLDAEIARFREKTGSGDRLTVLDGEAVEIGGVRFVGATLWTDLEAYGDGYASQLEFMKQMTDFRRIAWQGRRHQLKIHHFLDAHARQKAAIEAILATPFDGPTVVVTHHAPSRKSLDGGRCVKAIDAAYASDLEELILKYEPDLWIHGHIHHNLDYAIGRTRILSNPRGYVTRPHSAKLAITSENSFFDPTLVVEVHRRPAYTWANVEHALDHPDIFELKGEEGIQAIAALPHDEAVYRVDELIERMVADPGVTRKIEAVEADLRRIMPFTWIADRHDIDIVHVAMIHDAMDPQPVQWPEALPKDVGDRIRAYLAVKDEDDEPKGP